MSFLKYPPGTVSLSKIYYTKNPPLCNTGKGNRDQNANTELKLKKIPDQMTKKLTILLRICPLCVMFLFVKKLIEQYLGGVVRLRSCRGSLIG